MQEEKVDKKKQKYTKLKIIFVIALLIFLLLFVLKISKKENKDEILVKEDFANFVKNISSVEEEIKKKADALKSNGQLDKTDGQLYNFIAKGGTQQDDWLENGIEPEYTIIDENIGIELPEMYVSGIKVKYAITKEGKVFIWPPFEYNGEYYITQKDKVTSYGNNVEGIKNITIENVTTTIYKGTTGNLLNPKISTSQKQEEVIEDEANDVIENINNTNYTSGYQIRKIDITTLNLNLLDTSYIYDGLAKEPAIQIQNNGVDLVKDIDYVVTYTGNINVGTGVVSITGIGKYSGTQYLNFEIYPKEVNVLWTGRFILPHDGSIQKPTADAPTGIENETIVLDILGGETQVGTYTATATIGSVIGGQANSKNYVLRDVSKEFSISDVIAPLIDETNKDIRIFLKEELKWLSNEVNDGNTFEGYTIYLENNLDLGARFDQEGNLISGTAWVPIGLKYKLNGAFEGQNHTIEGVYVNIPEKYAGIFGNAHIIKDLTIKDSYIKGGNNCVGGILGSTRILGEEAGLIEN